MASLFLELFFIAQTLSGLYAEVPPSLEFVSEQEMYERVCEPLEDPKGVKVPCNTGGYYRLGSDLVVVLGEYDYETYPAQSLIVHEIVHYLQDKNNTPHTNCEDYYKKEEMAYNIQDEFLRINGDYGFPKKHILKQVWLDVQRNCRDEMFLELDKEEVKAYIQIHRSL